MMEEIPTLYAYIYRNLRKGFRVETIITTNSLIPYMKRVVHTAPKLVYSEIFKEMEKMKLVRLLGCDKCIILSNKDCERKLKSRLKEYVFPISPTS